MFTRGRLVPRQPRAIKRTTRTELRDENIRSDRCVHWNIGITPTALHGRNIHYAKYIHRQTITTQMILVYLQPIITQYFIDNKSEIWLLFLIAHSKR